MIARKFENLVLTQYPMLSEQRAEVERTLDGGVEFVIVSTFTPRGHIGLIQTLRRIKRERVYVFLGEDAVKPMMAVLIVLAMFVGAVQRFVILPDFRIRQFYKRDLPRVLGSLAVAGLLGVANLVLMALSVTKLVSSQRVRVNFPEREEGFAYLRTNLWLGIQAGGAMSHTRGIIAAASEVFKGVLVLTPDEKGLGKIAGSRIERVLPTQAYIIPRELNHFSYNRYFLSHAKKLLHDFKGILYQRTSLGSLVGVLLSRHFKRPLVLEYNGSELWMASNWGTPFVFNRLISLVETTALKHAHLVVTVSQALCDELVARGVDRSRIVFMPNAVNAEEFDPDHYGPNEITKIRARHGIAADAVVVTFVGTFGPWHGAEFLAKAALELSRQSNHSNQFHFLFIGDGVRRAEVELTVRELMNEGLVTLTGLIDQKDVPGYLAASDILVAPTIHNPDKSLFFGSPTKLFEYMAMARPVVVSRIGQIAEIASACPTVEEIALNDDREISDEEFGITVEAGHVGQLAKAISLAAEVPTWRQKAGNNARRIAIERYSWRQHFAEIIKNAERCVTRTRVLINALHSKSGGGVTYLRNLLPRLAKHPKLDLHVLVHVDQLFIFEGMLEGITVHTVDFKQTFFRLMFYEQVYLPVWERRLDADLVYSPANYVPLFCRNNILLLRNSLNVALVERRPGKLLYWCSLYTATVLSILRARMVLSVSEYAKRSAGGGLMSYVKKRSAIVPHGVDAAFHPLEFERRKPYELLAVSDLYVQKNLHTLLLALSKLTERFPTLTLSIAGASIDIEYANRLHSITKQLGLQDRVYFLGSLPVAKLISLYRECTVFVFPSTVETFGNPLVEAMACGAPIATTRTSAMPEIAGDAVQYFDPADADDMAEKIACLLTDSSLRRELGERAIERASRYSWDRNAEQLFEIFDRLNRP